MISPSFYVPGSSSSSTSDLQAGGTSTSEPVVGSTPVSSASTLTEATVTTTPSTISQTTIPSSTSASATSSTTSANAESGGLSSTTDSTKTKLAIALPIAIIGLLAVIGLIFFFYFRRRRQRNAPPSYEVAVGQDQSKTVSTSELLVVPTIVTTEPTPRFSAFGVPNTNIYNSSRGSSTIQSPDDANTELGLAIAVPMDQQMSATEPDPHDSTRNPDPNNNRRSVVRSPYQQQRDDDAVSVMSDLNERRVHEEDFDDMSSVSSFNDDSPRDRNHHSLR
jgi:hypothetical protein